MRSWGAFGAFAVTTLVAFHAVAQETSTSPPASVGAISPTTGSSRHAGERPPRSEAGLAAFVLRLANAEGAEISRVIERCSKLFDVAWTPPEEEEQSFNEAAARHIRAQEFTRRLEAERLEREALEFDSHLQRFLRETAFMKRLLDRQRAESVESNGGPTESERWRLYERR